MWTWTAIDADTKLCVSYLIGGRDALAASDFMADCASRIRGRVQITTDGNRVYLDAFEECFGLMLITQCYRKYTVRPTMMKFAAIPLLGASVAIQRL